MTRQHTFNLTSRSANSIVTLLLATLLTAGISFGTAPCVIALDPLPPGVTPPPGAPPPPGSGPNPPPLTSGDAPGARQNPPTGRPDPTSGSWFPHQPSRYLVPNNFGRYETNNGSGTRMVLPDLAPGLGRDANVTNPQLEQFQNNQYPYPGYSMNGRQFERRIATPTGTRVERVVSKRIWGDFPGRTNQQPNPAWRAIESERSPIPTVRLFCRILVIAGVVFATVYMAFAALSVVLGHPHGGQRIIGTAGGLMLLLMAYSIYKIVVINAFRFPNSAIVTLRTLPERPRANPVPADTPVVPAAADIPPMAARSNIRVRTFGNALNP